ncbi:MAG: hypothetical protein ACE14P_00715 [Methanotrichaceae archaeon]
MKKLVLLLAVLAMIEFAAAWDTADQMQYQYTHGIYMQAGDPSENGLINDIYSQASFQAPTPYGNSQGSTSNQLVWAGAVTPYNDQQETLLEPSQTMTLTQGGSALLSTHALDSQDNRPEVEASVSNYQNLHFSGVYRDEDVGLDVVAQFADNGNVGLGGSNPISLNELGSNLNNGWDGLGQITSGGNAQFTEADIGVASTSGLTWDKVKDQKTLSGSSTAYSAFTGGYTDAGSSNYIKTISGNFATNTWWQ